MGTRAAVSPAQPSESSPVPQLVGAADPDVVLRSCVPSHEELKSVLCLIFTPVAQSPSTFLPWFLTSWLAASLLQMHVCVRGC